MRHRGDDTVAPQMQIVIKQVRPGQLCSVKLKMAINVNIDGIIFFPKEGKLKA